MLRRFREFFPKGPGWLTGAPAGLALLALVSGCGQSIRRGEATPRSIGALALEQQGRRYHFGGHSPSSGFDCSGLVEWVYGQYGYSLPRMANEQFRFGKRVSRGSLREGDLVFFRMGRGREPDHVGIYLGDGWFIHAPSSGERVRKDWLGSRYWMEHYLGATRLLP